jgi:hypothetical protein
MYLFISNRITDFDQCCGYSNEVNIFNSHKHYWLWPILLVIESLILTQVIGTPFIICNNLQCRTNGVSDKWLVRPMACQSNGVSDQWRVGLMACTRLELHLLACLVMNNSRANCLSWGNCIELCQSYLYSPALLFMTSVQTCCLDQLHHPMPTSLPHYAYNSILQTNRK